MPKIFAFNPPEKTDYRDRMNLRPKGSLVNVGRGVLYADLGMRDMDVDKRLRMHQATGRDYLETKAMYNARKAQNKGDK